MARSASITARVFHTVRTAPADIDCAFVSAALDIPPLVASRHLARLVQLGVIRRAGVVRRGGRGRPMRLYTWH